MSQDLAIEKIKNGDNVLITGGAGVGKSYVIKNTVGQSNSDTLLCAPTGIAALNIGGTTAHKAFGLPMGVPTAQDYTTIPSKVKTLLGAKKLKRIVLDEIGMLRADQLDLIDHRLRTIRGSQLPFGGVQMVAVGDFYQLEPVVNRNDNKLFYDTYDTPFAFGSKSWSFDTIELTHVYRQENHVHSAVLNSLRKKDKHHLRALNWVNTNTAPYNEETSQWLHLCSYKADAANINIREFNKLNTNIHTYTGWTTAPKWGSEIPSDEVIQLREGARVVITANCLQGKYKNGHRGIVKKCFTNTCLVTLEDTGEDVVVEPFIWATYKYKNSSKGLIRETENEYSQLPLTLGWAISIHKSQGMTLDKIVVDVGYRGCFSHGQLYVGLSRAVDLTRVSLARKLTHEHLIVNDDVHKFYQSIQ